MYVLGITGGVGAGKSTVLSCLEEEYGALIIESDKVGHEVYEPGEETLRKVTELFDEPVLLEDGHLDRGKVGRLVFSDPKLLEKLNAVVHPAVGEKIREKIAKAKEEGRALVVLESAILLDVHYDELCDSVWYIFVNEQARAERLKSSRGYDDAKIEAILKNQKSDEQFREGSDAVIDNSGDFEKTREQIRAAASGLFQTGIH